MLRTKLIQPFLIKQEVSILFWTFKELVYRTILFVSFYSIFINKHKKNCFERKQNSLIAINFIQIVLKHEKMQPTDVLKVQNHIYIYKTETYPIQSRYGIYKHELRVWNQS